MSVQRSILSFLLKTIRFIKPSERMHLAKVATLVSLTLSLLMGFFKSSKNSSMRLCLKLYSANCPDQKWSSMQVQLKKTICINCVLPSPHAECVQEIDRYPTYRPTLVPPSQWYRHPGVNHQRRPGRCVLTNTIFISFP